MENKEEKEINWQAAEYRYFKKGWDWYLWVSGIATILFIFALWQKNFFFAIFIVIAAVMVISISQRRPRIIEFKIDNEGIYIGKDTAYKYDEIEWFAIRNRPESLNEIIIKKKTLVNPIVKIQADSKITSKARKILKEHLEEKEYESSLLDAILERFRF